MIALLVSGFIALFLFIVFGYFTTKLFSIPANITETLLIGLISVNIFTLIISLFYPITIYVLIAFISVSIVLVFYTKKKLVEICHSIFSEYHIIALSIPFILIGLYITLHKPGVFDSGLYHIQSIKWIEEYSTVPGLANLHHRFGFNPIIFHVYALTSLKDVFGQEIFSINLVLFSIFTVYFIHKLYHRFKAKGVDSYFIFYLIFFYVLLLLSATIASPAPDFLSSALLLFIFLQLAEKAEKESASTLKSYLPLLICSTYCIMTKLSTLPIGIFVVYILFSYRQDLKSTARICMGLILMCLPWFIKTILLTGWILYPLAAIDLFSFDWKVPSSVVQQLNTEIVGWARCPNDFYYEVAHMPLTKWVPIWWAPLTVYIKLLIIGSILFPIMMFVAQFINIISARRLTNMILCVTLSGVCFWFFTAPDFRFGQLFILIAVCSPLLYINFTFPLGRGSYLRKELLIIFICALLLLKFTRNNYRSDVPTLQQFVSSTWIKPEKINSENVVFTYAYSGNCKIYKPTQDERCFDHQIPCSHLDISSIELRGPNLTTGFRYTLKDK